MLILLTLFGLSLASCGWFPPIWSEDCKFTREDVYLAFKKYIDVNPRDDQITPKEIDEALAKYLPTYLKPLLYITDVHEILKSCDYDKNGVITERDFRLSNKTCLPFKRNWCSVEWFKNCIEEKEKQNHH